METPGRFRHLAIIKQPWRYHGRAVLSGTMEAAIYALTSKKIDEIFTLFGIKKSERIDPLITELSGIGE
jgi:hypothetical protein